MHHAVDNCCHHCSVTGFYSKPEEREFARVHDCIQRSTTAAGCEAHMEHWLLPVELYMSHVAWGRPAALEAVGTPKGTFQEMEPLWKAFQLVVQQSLQLFLPRVCGAPVQDWFVGNMLWEVMSTFISYIAT